MIRDHSHEHMSAETIQAFLEGDLPKREFARTEEQLAGCARCAGEVESWRLFFAELGELPVLRPHEGFGERVMAGVRIPQSMPLAARVRQRISGWMPGGLAQGHVRGKSLQDFVQGLLPARRVARIQAHLDGCGTCSKEVVAWRSVMGSLETLGHWAPADGFAARVMDEVQIAAPAPARAPARARARAALVAAGNAAVWAGGLLPQSQKAWAAMSGVAVAPMATLGLLLYTVFSHPTLTPGALLSFVGWKAAAFATMAWNATSVVLLESASLFRVYTFMESLAAAPATLAGGFAVFSCLMAAATWVLYKNLIATPSVDGQHAHVSA